MASKRMPFTGSCHCGQTRYIVFYTLPHTPHPLPSEEKLHGQRFYRCNCTPCQKAGLLHTRLNDPPSDFLLIAPLDPLGPDSSLSVYRCNTGRIAFLFCRTCGGRCFNFAGEGEVISADLALLGIEEDMRKRVKAEVDEQGQTKVWRPKPGFIDAANQGYLSVNGYSLDARQEGLDLREWHEKEHVMYLEYLDSPQQNRYGRPFEGGAY
jgi:hypothetical protein